MADTTVKTFDDITERLDEIIATVRSKDTSLERSLDLFDEAIRLGSKAVDMVDQFELSPREADLLDADSKSDIEASAADPSSPEDAS
ncbi:MULTISPECIES: exodeoxyribonuclease VII small subunit [unclassified Collinsella]|uniref:exodeoxyribonuclease VII small subunit n=1 Tax=unclassified Collinsella TaxID=2637548 RepID=UPI0011CA12A5|nr:MULTISPECIES: exodeoxyribonuclease VII small subunit [unclassified Collinsella]TXF36721.1 exodeoxyribonuclease VII small subunit [Collinsella sp. BA40]